MVLVCQRVPRTKVLNRKRGDKEKLKNKGPSLYITHQSKMPVDMKKINTNIQHNINQNMILPSTETVTRSPIYG